MSRTLPRPFNRNPSNRVSRTTGPSNATAMDTPPWRYAPAFPAACEAYGESDLEARENRVRFCYNATGETAQQSTQSLRVPVPGVPGAPTVRQGPDLRRRHPIDPEPQRQSRSGVPMERESVPGLFPCLCVLLCAPVSRVPGVRGRDGLRVQAGGQAERRGPLARGLPEPVVDWRARRLLR